MEVTYSCSPFRFDKPIQKENISMLQLSELLHFELISRTEKDLKLKVLIARGFIWFNFAWLQKWSGSLYLHFFMGD